VAEFERAVADFVGTQHAVAVSSGTAALHCAMYALGISPGDEVIVPPITFAATANCVVYQGGKPVFVDVDSGTLLIDPDKIEEKITPNTKAIIAVDYAGHPCDYDALRDIARRHGLFLVADACHALGSEYKGRKVGTLADLTVFSFHPVKHITTGEGGMITTDDPKLANRMRKFRNHGITRNIKEFTVHRSPFTVKSDSRPNADERTTVNSKPTALGREGNTADMRESVPPLHHPGGEGHGQGEGEVGERTTVNGQRAVPSWYYEMQDLGYNYRITDFQCALGISQLRKLPVWVERRREIAGRYDQAFAHVRGVEPLRVRQDVVHAYHLYVIRLNPNDPGMSRDEVFGKLQAQGIGVNVHYIPVHLHPYYRRHFGYGEGECPMAEKAYERILSLPIFPGMRDEDVEYVIGTVAKVVSQRGIRTRMNADCQELRRAPSACVCENPRPNFVSS
jgi:dTDP-4-amino-4,6-dideoxygalactose transaminase